MKGQNLLVFLFLFSILFLNLESSIGFGFLYETREILFNHTKEAINSTSLTYSEFNWNFSNPLRYIYNETELEIAEGVARLKTNESEGEGMKIQAKILEGFSELIEERTQTARHFYNPSSGSYHYQSDYLVKKEGVVAGSDWITIEEYPIRYILRLRNSTIKAFAGSEGIINYLNLIDNSSIWFIGIESFNGVFGFYLNSMDSINGHSQGLYYPRLKNGEISAYNQPLYAIFTDLFVKVGLKWYNETINNRSLFSHANNPQNNLLFLQPNNEVFGMQFLTQNVVLKGFSFDIISGIKYNKSEQRFHMITEFKCLDRDFDDIGAGYNILSTPQAEFTPYDVAKFRIRNETDMVEISKENLWKHDELIDNCLSAVNIVSVNGEEFTFDFEDLGESFLYDYLELIDYDLPNGEQRKSLLAGMFGYGVLLQNNWVRIDPTFNEKQTVDEYDLNVIYDDGKAEYETDILDDDFEVGFEQFDIFHGLLTFDTGITEYISSVSNVEITFFLLAEYFESDDRMSYGIYLNDSLAGGFWNETYATAHPETAFFQTTYWNYTEIDLDGYYEENITLNASYYCLSNWTVLHNLNPSANSFIAFYFWNGTNLDEDKIDYAKISESTDSPSSYRPTLTFDYVLGEPEESPELDSPSDKELAIGFSNENISWIPTERTNSPANYSIFKNSSNIQNGTWSNQTAIVLDLDQFNSTIAFWNFTIVINDSEGLESNDTVFVNISAIPVYYYELSTVETMDSLKFITPLKNFVESASIPSNTGLKYQLILNGAKYYFNGSVWLTITFGQNDSYYYQNETNNESEINDNIEDLAEQGVLKFKAFLYNGVNSTPELDNIYVNTSYISYTTEIRLIANNSLAFLGFHYDSMQIAIDSQFNVQNISEGDTINMSIGLVIRTELFEFEIIPVMDLKLLGNCFLSKEIDFDSRRIFEEESDRRNISIVNSFSPNDLVFVVDRDSNVFQSGFSVVVIEYWKDEFEVRQDFLESVYDFDSFFDIPLAFLCFPLVFLSSGVWYIQMIGVVIGIVFLAFWVLFAKYLWREIGDVVS